MILRGRVPRAFAALLAAAFLVGPSAAQDDPRPPWERAGLSERRAAVHLLERLTWGPRPGDVERLLEIGLERWFEAQLAGDLPGSVYTSYENRFPAVRQSAAEHGRLYAHRHYLVQEAIAEGRFTAEEYAGRLGEGRREHAERALTRYAADQGYRPEQDLIDQLGVQKLYRAIYSESQIVEVLTDFWLNHFNVSTGKQGARVYVLAYERDAVRPHVLGRFRDLLGAVAAHPAMLWYLDGTLSTADPDADTTLDVRMRSDWDRFAPTSDPFARERLAKNLGWRPEGLRLERLGELAPAEGGLNENYARELLELHTLGVDGGYSQADVVETARAFTGWAAMPTTGRERRRLEQAVDTAEAAELGLARRGEMIFRPERHDAGEKAVLGVVLPAGRGIEDGDEVLDLVAAHPSTARHIARKMAARFIADEPPAAVVERLARVFTASRGDLREMTRTLFEAPEFWRAAAQREKIRSPFAYLTASLRALDADLFDVVPLLAWLRRAGQPLYAYDPPTGYDDRASTWLHVGPLLERLNLAFALGDGQLEGVRVDLAALLGREQPGSLEEALVHLLPIVAPGREIASLEPWLAQRVAEREEAEEIDPEAAPAPREALRYARRAVGLLLAAPETQRY